MDADIVRRPCFYFQYAMRDVACGIRCKDQTNSLYAVLRLYLQATQQQHLLLHSPSARHLHYEQRYQEAGEVSRRL